jgi:hypothetical protein
MSVSDVSGPTAVSAGERDHYVAVGLWLPVFTMNTTNLYSTQKTYRRVTWVLIDIRIIILSIYRLTTQELKLS